MASHALDLYMASCSTYNLDGVPASIDLVPESTFVRQEARMITEVRWHKLEVDGMYQGASWWH
jgi:hypothetical protein